MGRARRAPGSERHTYSQQCNSERLSQIPDTVAAPATATKVVSIIGVLLHEVKVQKLVRLS